MPRLPNESQLNWEIHHDPIALGPLIRDGFDALAIKREKPEWGINRIKRAIKNYRSNEVIRSLQTSKVPGKEPPTSPEVVAPEDASSLNIVTGTHYAVIVADISLGSQHKSFIKNLLKFADQYGYLPIFCVFH